MSGPEHSGYFRCPFCSTLSYSAYDAEHGYCARCKVFVDDVREAPPEIRRETAQLYLQEADRNVDRSEQLRRTAAAWLYLNHVDPSAGERR
jgi:hypothetical protein